MIGMGPTFSGSKGIHFGVRLPCPWGSNIKESACNAGELGSVPGSGRSPGEGNGNCSSIPAWKILWTEEPGGLQSMRSQGVRHNWATNTCTFTFLSPVFSFRDSLALQYSWKHTQWQDMDSLLRAFSYKPGFWSSVPWAPSLDCRSKGLYEA